MIYLTEVIKTSLYVSVSFSLVNQTKQYYVPVGFGCEGNQIEHYVRMSFVKV
jgi:hypothetical protein